MSFCVSAIVCFLLVANSKVVEEPGDLDSSSRHVSE